MSQDASRRCLEELDVVGARRVWAHVAPHLPQPKTDSETLVTMHMVRTISESMPFNLRAYSHRWLLDHNYPSQLPDHLKPKAERIYPKIVTAVGISVNGPAYMKDVLTTVRLSMEDAVNDCYADGKTEPEFVRARMKEAREKVLKHVGRTGR